MTSFDFDVLDVGSRKWNEKNNIFGDVSTSFDVTTENFMVPSVGNVCYLAFIQ